MSKHMISLDFVSYGSRVSDELTDRIPPMQWAGHPDIFRRNRTTKEPASRCADFVSM